MRETTVDILTRLAQGANTTDGTTLTQAECRDLLVFVMHRDTVAAAAAKATALIVAFAESQRDLALPANFAESQRAAYDKLADDVIHLIEDAAGKVVGRIDPANRIADVVVGELAKDVLTPRTDRGICTYCRGNDLDVPCAYPGAGKPGCLRDARFASMR